MNPPKRILIVGPSWVGDMVMAQSLFAVLKQRNPEVLIDVLAPGWALPLLKFMPEVRAGVEMSVGHGQLGLRARFQIARRLQIEQYDQAIVLPGSLKSALVPYWSNIPRRTGFRGEVRFGLINDMRHLDKMRLRTTLSRFVALAYDDRSPEPVTTVYPHFTYTSAQIDEVLRTHGLTLDKPALVLCPGAEYGPAKRWPAKHFAVVADAALKRGQQVWLIGSDKDTEIANEIRAMSSLRDLIVPLCGKTSLEEAVLLIAAAKQVVSNDSGLMHVAAAVDTPLIAIYGSSDPSHTPPLTKHATVLSLRLECSPCMERECPLGHLRCLNELDPERVIQALL